MPSSECLGVAQPHSTRGQDGTLWFATAKGLVHTDPEGRGSSGRSSGAVDRSVGGRCQRGCKQSDWSYPRAWKTWSSSSIRKIWRIPRRWSSATSWMGMTAIGRSPGTAPRIIENFLPGIIVFWSTRAMPARRGTTTSPAIAVHQQPYFYQAWWFYALLCCAGRGGRGALVPLEAGSRQGRARRGARRAQSHRARVARHVDGRLCRHLVADGDHSPSARQRDQPRQPKRVSWQETWFGIARPRPAGSFGTCVRMKRRPDRFRARCRMH